MARGRRQRRPQTQGTSCVTIHSHYACTPVFVRLFNGPISSDTCEGGVWDNLRERRSPLLGKGGDAAPSSNWSRSFGGAAGVVRSTSDNRWLEPTTPSAPPKELRGIFLMGAATPPCPRRGLRLSLQLFSMPPVSSKRCGTWRATEEGSLLRSSLFVYLGARPVSLRNVWFSWQMNSIISEPSATIRCRTLTVKGRVYAFGSSTVSSMSSSP